MKSNYKRIGEYIREVSERNKELSVSTLMGINIDKYFMPSVANTIGTDMSKYKIVKKGQFACNRMHVGRDKKLPIALHSQDESIIVSPAYSVFEIIDESILDPEYLMMWFSRKEFDRNAWFYTDADVRGGLKWEDFCNIELPVPSIEEQRKIIKEYRIITDRIIMKNKLIAKLQDTINTIYKQWFLEFDFPDSSKNGYKSSGGKMYFNIGMNKEIPDGWEAQKLGYYITESKGGDWGKDEEIGNYTEKTFCIRGADIPKLQNGSMNGLPIRYILKKNLDSKQLTTNQIVVEISGGSPTQSTGRAILITESLLKVLKNPIICSNFCQAITIDDAVYSNLIFSHINYLYKANVFFNYENSTIALKNLDLADILSSELVVKPPKHVLEEYNLIFNKINKAIISYGKEIDILEAHKELILSDLMITKTM